MLDRNTVDVIRNMSLPPGFRVRLCDILAKLDMHKETMKIDKVYLFGSCAREDARYGSDIDLLLLTSADTEREVRIKALQYDIDDDASKIPVQVSVRKTSRFDSDTASGNDKTENAFFLHMIKPDLKLLLDYRKGDN